MLRVSEEIPVRLKSIARTTPTAAPMTRPTRVADAVTHPQSPSDGVDAPGTPSAFVRPAAPTSSPDAPDVLTRATAQVDLKRSLTAATTGGWTYLDEQLVAQVGDALIEQAVAGDPNAFRAALLSGINPMFVGLLPTLGSPAFQLRSDLMKLNGTHHLTDGSVPLARALANAATLIASEATPTVEHTPAEVPVVLTQAIETLEAGGRPDAATLRALVPELLKAAPIDLFTARRDELLQGILPGYAGTLSVLPEPRFQVHMDLTAMAEVTLRNGDVPLLTYLRNVAAALEGKPAEVTKPPVPEALESAIAQVAAADPEAIRPGSPWFDADTLHGLQKALAPAMATAGSSVRPKLFAGVHPGFVGSIPYMPQPIFQLTADLHRLNTVGHLTDGSVPMRQYLENFRAYLGG